jgi:hypothetical protein
VHGATQLRLYRLTGKKAGDTNHPKEDEVLTPHEKREAAIALGEFVAAEMVLNAAIDRLNMPQTQLFVPRDALTELVVARENIRRVVDGLNMLVSTS